MRKAETRRCLGRDDGGRVVDRHDGVKGPLPGRKLDLGGGRGRVSKIERQRIDRCQLREVMASIRANQDFDAQPFGRLEKRVCPIGRGWHQEQDASADFIHDDISVPVEEGSSASWTSEARAKSTPSTNGIWIRPSLA